MKLERVIGKKSEKITDADLIEKFSGYECVHYDLGTGDGLFAWRLAKELPETFVIGFDADRNSLAEASARAIKKPARGGTPNGMFICMNVLELPELLEGSATSVSVNFPWGSLLHAVAYPLEGYPEKLRMLLKQGGHLTLHINMYVFQNEEQRQNLDLPDLDEAYLKNTVIPAYENAGFKLIEVYETPSGDPVPVASTWGGRLTRNSGRATLSLQMEAV